MSREPFPCPDYEGDEPAAKPISRLPTPTVTETIWKTIRAFQALDMEPPSITLGSHRDGLRFLSEILQANRMIRHDPVRAVIPILPPECAAEWKPNAEPKLVDDIFRLELPHGGKLVWLHQGSADAEPFMEMQFMGVKVRWPAECLRTIDGASVWY